MVPMTSAILVLGGSFYWLCSCGRTPADKSCKVEFRMVALSTRTPTDAAMSSVLWCPPVMA